MELLVMLLIPLPIGFFVRNRVAGYLAYIAVQGFAFTFQTLYLLLDWIGGEAAAFGTNPPHADAMATLSYGAVNAVIFLAGLGLVRLGQHLAARRAAKRPTKRDPSQYADTHATT